MKVLKSPIQLTTLVLSFVFTNAVLAADSITNMDDGANITIGNVVFTKNAVDNAASPVAQANTAVSDQQTSDAQSYRKQMDEHRRQVQEAQLEAYNRFLERRKQNTADYDRAFNDSVPAHIQVSRIAMVKEMEQRRKTFIKEMDERRALNIKMMEQHRKAAEERRAEMRLKMHQTKTAPELAGKA